MCVWSLNVTIFYVLNFNNNSHDVSQLHDGHHILFSYIFSSVKNQVFLPRPPCYAIIRPHPSQSCGRIFIALYSFVCFEHFLLDFNNLSRHHLLSGTVHAKSSSSLRGTQTSLTPVPIAINSSKRFSV